MYARCGLGVGRWAGGLELKSWAMGLGVGRWARGGWGSDAEAEVILVPPILPILPIL